ncbi:37S ribosomal protein, mitochondrial [Chytridiales sp. JEL 0842]|nr:37S ribosomal protein, mitochondrial [Chytridiales sp. JEL 0842]
MNRCLRASTRRLPLLHQRLAASVSPYSTQVAADQSQNLSKSLEALVPKLTADQRPTTIAQDYKPFQDPIHAKDITLRSLLAANLHLGHEPNAWNKSMLPYIYGTRGGLHIINLEHTLVHLRRAVNVTREVALRGGNIVFVGTKPSLHRMTVEAAKRANAYFVIDWVSGTITNKERVLRRSSRFDPDKVAQAMVMPSENTENLGEVDEETAKVIQKAFSKQPRVHVPDLLIVLDMPNNITAIREANQLNIPIISICDTDCNPRLVQYPIPANDDSLTGVELIAGVLSKASASGAAKRAALFEERA